MGSLHIIKVDYPDLNDRRFVLPPLIKLRLLDGNDNPLFEFELPVSLKLFVDDSSNMTAMKTLKG